MLKYFKEVLGELKQVTWPTRSETIKLTFIVIAISTIVSIYLGGLDLGFTKLLGVLLK